MGKGGGGLQILSLEKIPSQISVVGTTRRGVTKLSGGLV